MNQTDIPIHLDLSNLDYPDALKGLSNERGDENSHQNPHQSHHRVKFESDKISPGPANENREYTNGNSDLLLNLLLDKEKTHNRRRSNSRSQVVAAPNIGSFSYKSNPTSQQSMGSFGSHDSDNGDNESHSDDLTGDLAGGARPPLPKTSTGSVTVEDPKKRKQVQYFVTLTSLNETFAQKHLSVPYYPDTRKLGRPTGAKIKPDVSNGFFDSRVLSRNHAAMYIDVNTGKLMLKDLGSSNGTFVNDKKLDTEPVEIKVGDNVCFGFNIQVGINHKQINAKVENINIMNDILKPNANGGIHLNKNIDSVEYKHYQYIQDLYNKVKESSTGSAPANSQANKMKSNPANFETALFSDVNPDIEDNLLGLYTKANNGIFKNSGTSSTSKLEHSINILVNCLTKIKQQNNSLTSLEEFLESYKSKLNDLNESYLKHQYDTKLSETLELIDQEKSCNDKLRGELKMAKDDNYKKTKKLEEKIFKLKDDKQSLSKQISELNRNILLKDETLSNLEQELEGLKKQAENADNSQINHVEEDVLINSISDPNHLNKGFDFEPSHLSSNIIKGDDNIEHVHELLDSNSNSNSEPGSNSNSNSDSNLSSGGVVHHPTHDNSNINSAGDFVEQFPEEGDDYGNDNGYHNRNNDHNDHNNSNTNNNNINDNNNSDNSNSDTNNSDTNNGDNNSNNNNDGDGEGNRGNEDNDPNLPFTKVPASIAESEIDEYDVDNDLRYNNGVVAIGITCIIVGILIHKFT